MYELDPDIHIVMHWVLSLKPVVIPRGAARVQADLDLRATPGQRLPGRAVCTAATSICLFSFVCRFQ